MADTQRCLLDIDNDISLLQNGLLTFPRPHLLRSSCLFALADKRFKRYILSRESEDLDKTISHSTEAILLPFHTQSILTPYHEAILLLANALIYRSQTFKQSCDLEYAIKYIHYIQDQSLEISSDKRNQIKGLLVWALAIQLSLESIDPTRNIEEMATLCHELLRPGVEESLLYVTIQGFADGIRGTTVAFGQPPPDNAIECLREARIRLPNLKKISFVLALSLHTRFNWARKLGDYKEGMSILDELIADPNADVKQAMDLAESFTLRRFNYDPKPEHLAEAILRNRTHLNAISSKDPNYRSVVSRLEDLEKAQFEMFGVRSGRQDDNAEVIGQSHLAASPQMAKSNLVEFPLPIPEDRRGLEAHLKALGSIMDITDQTNMVKAIEYCRLCLTSPHSHYQNTLRALGILLHRLFDLTGNIEYLHESITRHRDLLKLPRVPGPTNIHSITANLIDCLRIRFNRFKDRRDAEEILELFAVAVTDTSTDVPLRFRTSHKWCHVARLYSHPSTLLAYQIAISLMQESLSFAPTLKTQHSNLVAMRNAYEWLPLDYASYLIQIGQLGQAIEALEQGRGLLWSEMRGLRTSIDQLSAVNLPLAETFVGVNRDLEALTVSGSQVVWMEDRRTSGSEGVDPFDRLVVKQRKLVEERDRLISQIRAQPGFESFLIPPSFNTLRSAAAGGPVILINHSRWRSDIIILLHDSPPSLILTSDDFYPRAKGLHEQLLGARKTGLDSGEYEDTLEEVLRHLYDLVGSPVIERLRELRISEQSRVWWCPTSVFCSLPLHAMGPISSNGPTKLYFSDIYISSYTPTLSALIESREPSTQPLDVPSMLLVVQPDDEIPSSIEEMHIVQAVCPSVETLNGKVATPIVTLDCLRRHQFVHISCHGELETGKPFDAYFELYEGARLTLLDIVRSQLPSAEFAFLSACHTAEITEESIANEGLHLAAAVQYCGFRSVVGTMWAVVDEDGPPVAEKLYKSVFSVTERWEGKPYYARTAEALRDAVRGLRKEMTLESWVNYVHYGA